MSQSNPLVSIGMPVYNGAQYIDQAIESIIGQSYTNFELMISDNASTDDTHNICLKWQNIDNRITYNRNEKNQGAIPNFNHLVGKAKGKYFKWAAHDDYLDKENLQSSVACLENNENVVLCYSWVKIVDGQNKLIKDYPYPANHLNDKNPAKRFKNLIYNDLECFEIFGLIRTDVLKRTPLFGSYVASDRILLADLVLAGPFHCLESYLFFNRDHPESSTRRMPTHQQRDAWFDATQSGAKRKLPHWKIMVEYNRSVSRASISVGNKKMCRLYLAGWIFRNMNWAWLFLDLLLYIYPQAWKFFFKFRKNKKWKDEG